MEDTETKIMYPAALRPGDTIGIVAPAGAFDHMKLHRGISVVEQMGFKVFTPKGLFEKEDYLAGSDEHRAQILNHLFQEPSIKAVICARGGFGSVRILSLLDYKTIRDSRKIFLGFSDITAILTTFQTRCGLIGFHGPMITSLADANTESRDAMYKALTSNRKLTIKPGKGLTLKSGVRAGTVTGGNLATLCHLVGTPFEPDLNGHILVLEDVGEPHYKIDRMLIQMKLAGCFKGLSGLVLGSFENCGTLEGIYRIVERLFKEYDYPVLAGFEIGHGTTNITFPVGLKATLDADNHMLIYHSPAVR
ncbi:MAG: LD-carboxypeptidase [Pseudomonadota bacterium]